MNRLANSLSPYLLQHQHNPVDWFPWSEQAFELAIERDVPVFLSVGYAACHWCHVMEHESFENESIAEFLNENFVSIKVDREERPDIDQIYMNAVQAMTGRGGWPMSVFLNHDRQPFYAGTYWPPTQKFGMPGFAQVLGALVDAWQNRRAQVDQQAGEITAALRQMAAGPGESSSTVPADAVISSATDYLLGVLDRQSGGFGGAPKFPHATDLILLLQRGITAAESELITAAEFTLDRMAAGGIRDHIGGGFARYSVDAKWLVPHFEKMLYDNALLAEVYVRAYQVTGHQRHADVARETLDYLCRDMFDPSGGIHCSEDADSEGVEGKFYVWTPREVIELLGDERGERFCRIYDITAAGNFEGKSIPNLPRPISDWAGELAIGGEELSRQLAVDREQLRLAREQRVKPDRDDKVLTAWNALAIRALAVGGAVLEENRYLAAAERAADFVVSTMMKDNGRLLHAFRAGQAHLAGYIDDYAYTIDAFIHLFEATGRARWIGRAVKLADVIVELFEDKQSGGFFYTAADADELIARNKEWHDGSLVSGNAAAVIGLLKLSRLCDRSDYRAAAERGLAAAAEVMEKQSAACGALLSALDRYWHDQAQLVLAVDEMEQVSRLRGRFLRQYRPRATLSWVVGQAPDSGPVVALNRHKPVLEGEPTLYRCKNFTCDRPLLGQGALDWLMLPETSAE
jgi:uncharacterized protein YyaL (SSP411 family)